MARPKKAKAEKVDPIEAHGDNYAAVLQGYMDELMDNDLVKSATADARRDIVKRAKADGFTGEMLNGLHREAKLAPDIRMERHLRLEAGRKALKLYGDLFEYADNQ